MRTLIRLAALAAAFALLASCGGEQPPATGTATMGATRASETQDPEHEKLVQQLYVGFFGRPADPAGLAYYVQVFRDINAPRTLGGLQNAYRTNNMVRTLIDSFAASAESRQLYPYCEWIGCDASWVSALYRSLFSREAEAAGAQFWSLSLNSKSASRAFVLLSVLAGAQGADAELVARKIRIATQFTRSIEASGKQAAYSGQLANLIAREMLQNSPGYSDDAVVQEQLDATAERLSRLAAGTVEEVAAGTRKLVLLASGERMGDSGARLSALASAMESDLNQLRPGGPQWKVAVMQAAGSILAIRDQLKGYDGAILVGQLPMPGFSGTPFLDLYRLPDCRHFQLDDAGQVLNVLALRSVDPACRNGLVVSVLRGTTPQAESAEIAGKLDQMIAYHKASSAANAKWLPRFRFIEAGWFAGIASPWVDRAPLWSATSLFPADAVSYLYAGTSVQRRDAFLDCLRQNNEICAALLHGAPDTLMFEGPGVPGQMYSGDSVDWHGTELAPQSVKAKYVELLTCSSQNFLIENSIGTSLLMRGDALLTRGMTSVAFVFQHAEEDMIKNEYALLENGNMFAEALYGRLESTPESIQGDPYITMRPAPAGARPKLLIDGKHYNGGAQTVPVAMPDAAGGASAIRVITFSNRGDADLRLRVGSGFEFTSVDDGSGEGAKWEYGYNAQYTGDTKQVHSDGRVLDWPDIPLEQNGGMMPVTLKPGQSVAITYKLDVRTGPDGKPKLPGLYTGQVSVTSNDPGSARINLTMQGRVR